MEKFYFLSLGCDKNLVDSEQMISLLSTKGYEYTSEISQADAIIINTCAFIGDAKEESINAIFDAVSYKETGKCRAVIIAGCLSERYFEEISEEIPEVDGCIGATAFDKIADVLDEVLHEKKCFVREDINKSIYLKGHRTLSTGGHYAYLKIADGCNKRCTYCAIPLFKGSFRSVPMEDIIEDAIMLSKRGVKELIIVAQETTLYGTDIYGKKALPELLRKLCEIPEIYWIRLQYSYPEEITDELIEVIRTEPKICHYLDMPIQHASDSILKAMGRKTNQEDLIKVIKKLRDNIPDIAIRTTLISGFPGETDKDHEDLMDFVRKVKFDRLGVFTYSAEEGTKAALFDNQVALEVANDRQAEIMELQQSIAFEMAKQRIGNEYLCMIEGNDPETGVYIGRTYMDAPDVDGLIFIETDENLYTGDFAKVRVTGAYEYDLIGELL